MMIREIGPFSYGAHTQWTLTGRGPKSDLCHRVMFSWFAIDTDRPLWLRIHTRPAKDRLKVVRDAPGQYLVFVETDGAEVEVLVNMDWYYKPPATYPYYVEIVQ